MAIAIAQRLVRGGDHCPAEGIPTESVLTLLNRLLIPAVVGHQASLAIGTDSQREEHLDSPILRAICRRFSAPSAAIMIG